MDVLDETIAGVRPIEAALPATTALKPALMDGRRLRSERTKQLIIGGYLALLRENQKDPTAAQIAERAGYSVRSVFERFPDLLALRVAAADYALVQVATLAPVRHADGDRKTRLKSHVETRAGTCERGVALWRALLYHQDNSKELKRRVRLGRDRTVARFEIMYKPELSILSDLERKHILIALEALTDIESWARMREFYALSFEEACAVWIDAIDRLLPPTPSVS